MRITLHTKLVYRNAANEELILTPFTKYWCEKCEETMSNQIHSQKQVATHGKFFTGMSLDERYIVLTGTVMPGISTHVAISMLQRVFNPTLAGVLYFENTVMHIKRNIACRIEKLPNVYWSRGALKFDVNLVCLEPFWRGEDIIEYIALTIKQFKFPVAVPRSGMSFATRKQTLESKFENMGNVESSFQATIRANGGTVINPEIRNELTGEKIQLRYTMQKYDTLLIVNSLQEKRVEINGVNVFNCVIPETTKFFKLAVGTNRIGYFAEQNVSNMSVHITYTPLYTHAEVL